MRLVDLFNLVIARINGPTKFAIKNGVSLGDNCKIRTFNFGSEPYLIKMGSNVSTARGVSFVNHDGGVEVLRNLYNEFKDADLIGTIEIGDNVFIGLNSTVLYGSKIGSNVIIGSHSIVKGELKSNSVYAGVPAKYICSINEYREKNSKNIVRTKGLTNSEKKKYLLNHFFDN
ncbi:acyltransferase [Lutimonas zeaxanthinifaciens]|uniref:acyltransferase n=1 Tax=Lutimonas zeaxanthinifaciens TaxID=3060215 RepID=UPI00265CA24A|nr:acyltransferase [Lutimonas sp. YSD2104]WKK66832.1 acyltransferase [Lutimonas sp. YSD2104]